MTFQPIKWHSEDKKDSTNHLVHIIEPTQLKTLNIMSKKWYGAAMSTHTKLFNAIVDFLLCV